MMYVLRLGSLPAIGIGEWHGPRGIYCTAIAVYSETAERVQRKFFHRATPSRSEYFVLPIPTPECLDLALISVASWC